jgi:hypothetical protein
MNYSNRIAVSYLFEPSQPDVAPRSDVVVPDRDCDWPGVYLGHEVLSGYWLRESIYLRETISRMALPTISG